MKNIFIIFLLSWFSVGGQTPEIIWEQGYGGNDDDRPKEVILTPENGFLTIGYILSNDGDIDTNQGAFDFWIVKTDEFGNLLWQHSYGGSGFDRGLAICNGSDGGYILAGGTSSVDGDISFNYGETDFWILKIDNFGNIEWEKSYGGSNYDEATSVIQTTDGGYIVLGISYSDDGLVTNHHGSTGTGDYWILKIDNSGNIEWEKSYGSTEDESSGEIIQASNGEYVATGTTQGSNGDVEDNWGAADYWIIRITELGEIVWSKTYGGTSWEENVTIVESINNGFIVAGSTQANGGLVTGYHGGIYDGWVVSIDSLGSLKWAKTYGGSEADDDFTIIKKNENEYILCGRSHSIDGDVSDNYGISDYWLFEIDSSGNINWETSVGGSEVDAPNDLTISHDGQYVVTGYSSSTDYDVTETYIGFNYWTVKLGFCTNHYYADIDGDGFGDILNDSIACNLPIGYVLDSTDCDDLNELIFPTAIDICNSIDDNCNGLTDEDATLTTWYLDYDTDGFGDILNDSISCLILAGYVYDNTDCNDLNFEINPAAIEICNDIDDNCNFDIDEGLPIYTFYIDSDGDNFGNSDIFLNSCLEIITGYVLDSTDCDDANNLIYPGAIEICDYLDNDCNGIIDDNLSYIHSFEDVDADNFGNIEVDSLSCEIPVGFVEDDSDCDDTNPLIYPGADEILNGIDDDCNELIDEGLEINNILASLIKIYPNPANDILNIEFSGAELISFEILNTVGEKVLFGEINNSQIAIDISKLKPGVYFFRVTNDVLGFEFEFVKE